MCGIFGVITQDEVEREAFIALAESNKIRGNLGFGGFLAHWRDHLAKEQVFRYNKPFDEDLLPSQPAQVALGHIRAPTNSRTNALEEIHPFAVDDLLLAHNGLLLNHLAFPNWKLDPAISVDSQVILGGIQCELQQTDSLPCAIARAVSQLEGQQACWLWQKAQRKLYLWRVMVPVYWRINDGRFVFSSMVSSPGDNILEEGIVYEFDFTTMQLSTSAQFTFHSPYLAR